MKHQSKILLISLMCLTYSGLNLAATTPMNVRSALLEKTSTPISFAKVQLNGKKGVRLVWKAIAPSAIYRVFRDSKLLTLTRNLNYLDSNYDNNALRQNYRVEECLTNCVLSIRAVLSNSKSGPNYSARAYELAVASGNNNINKFYLIAGSSKYPLLELKKNEPNLIETASKAVQSSLDSLKAEVSLPDGATIDPDPAQLRSYSSSVSYRVTAADGEVATYNLTIKPYDAVNNPYGVYNVADLHGIANDMSSSYKQMNNIILPQVNFSGQSGCVAEEIPFIADYCTNGWKGIGYPGNSTAPYFNGSYDGNNFAVKNLVSNDGSATAFGFFTKVGKEGKITNTKVEVGSANLNTVGWAGALVGLNLGMIENSSATGVGEIISFKDGVGGLVGYNSGKIIKSSSTINVTTSFRNVGGLVGSATGSSVISKSFATGNVSLTGTGSQSSAVGGLVGNNQGAIDNSYARGNVSGIRAVGGLVGYFVPSNATTAIIDRVNATGVITGTEANTTGGVIGSINLKSGTRASAKYAVWDTEATGVAVGVGSAVSGSQTLFTGKDIINGLTTNQMKLITGTAQQNFPGYNDGRTEEARNIWLFTSGSYPLLK